MNRTVTIGKFGIYGVNLVVTFPELLGDVRWSIPLPYTSIGFKPYTVTSDSFYDVAEARAWLDALTEEVKKLSLAQKGWVAKFHVLEGEAEV